MVDSRLCSAILACPQLPNGKRRRKPGALKIAQIALSLSASWNLVRTVGWLRRFIAAKVMVVVHGGFSVS
jgi:hypothetical protein